MDANDWKSLAIGALTFVISGVIWYLKELTGQVRENRDKLTLVDKTCITRAELQTELREVREIGTRRHEENQSALQRADDKQTKILDSMNVVALEMAVLKRLHERDSKR